MPALPSIDSFELPPGRKLAARYEVVSALGAGWESEVYLIRETTTGIERAAKLFFPERNPGNRIAVRMAAKLHELRDCQSVVQYVAQEKIRFRRQPVTALISEYVSGELLADFLASQPGRRLHSFEALHLLHALACALEPVHQRREYHGDLHPGNVIISRRGISFDIKLIDICYDRAQCRRSIREDVYDLIKIFYDAIGGSRFYSRQSNVIKGICRGMKRSLIAERFQDAGQLRRYLESLNWNGN